jgi:hypothetical protein
VLLGNAPPRTIKVPPDGTCRVENTDTTDDDSSYHSSDETELLSSSEHDADSSDDESGYRENSGGAKTAPHVHYMTRPARRMWIARESDRHKPFVALPPLNKKEVSCSSDESESSDDGQPARKVSRKDPESVNERPMNGHEDAEEAQPTLLHLSPLVRPIDLTTDHSAYNPAEVAAVLRRCNNAPQAISGTSKLIHIYFFDTINLFFSFLPSDQCHFSWL